MKKLLVWLLMLSMCLSLVGCKTAFPGAPEGGSSAEQTTVMVAPTITAVTTAQNSETSPSASDTTRPDDTTGRTTAAAPHPEAVRYTSAMKKLMDGTPLEVQTKIVETGWYLDTYEVSESTYTTVVSGGTTAACRSRTVAKENGRTYTEYYADGMVYRDMGSQTYKSKQDPAEYRTGLWDVWITPSYYGTIDVSHNADGSVTMHFKDANTHEKWIYGEEVKVTDPLMVVIAEVDIDKNGVVTAIRYSAEQWAGTYSNKIEATYAFKKLNTADTIQIPASAQALEYIDCVPIDVITNAVEWVRGLESYQALIHIQASNESSMEDLHFVEETESTVSKQDALINYNAVSSKVWTRGDRIYKSQMLGTVYNNEKGGFSSFDMTTGSGVGYESASHYRAMSKIRRTFLCSEARIDTVENIKVTDLGDAWLFEFDYAKGYDGVFIRELKENIFPGHAYKIVEELHHRGAMVVDKATGHLVSVYEQYVGDLYENHIIGQVNRVGELSYSVGCSIIPTEEVPAVPAEQKAKPVLYRVTGKKGQKMYLLGTIHVGDVRSQNLPKELYDAFDKADAYAEETDFTAASADPAYSEELMKTMVYSTPGETVKQHLSESGCAALRTFITRMGYYEEDDLANYSLAYWQQRIQDYLMRSGSSLSYGYGVDGLLEERAYGQGKKVYGIEDWRDHISITTMFDDDVNEMLLLDLLRVDPKNYEKQLQYSYELWCAGNEWELALSNDADAAADMTAEQKKLYKTYREKLITRRDAGMVKAAKKYLESGETVFMAVGHAHVIGKNGVAAQLKAAGYTVEVVQYK